MATSGTADPPHGSSARNDRGRLVRTVLALLLFSWAWQTTGIALGGLRPGNPVGFALTLGPVMFSPLVASLLYVRASGRRVRNLAWGPGRPGFLLLGLATPTLMMLVLVGLWQLAGFGGSALLALTPAGFALPRGPWVLGPMPEGGAVSVLNVAATMLAFGLLNSLATIGEELGWRGVFQAEFVEEWGLTRGVAALGLVWGIWHLPVNLTGYNYPAFPVLGALVLFPLTLVGHSFVLAWLTLEGRSFWPAVLFHAGINSMYAGVTSSLWRPGRAAEFHALELVLVSGLGWAALTALRRRPPGARLSAA